MKICIISPKAYPLFNIKVKSVFGGAEMQLSWLGKELAKNNNLDVNFIVADYAQQEMEEYGNIKVWRSLNFKSNIVKQIKTFYQVFNKVNADVYIQMTLNTYSGIIALYCKKAHKKMLYLVASDREVNGTSPILQNPIRAFMANQVFKSATHIISQGRYQQNQLLKRNIKSAIIPSFRHIENIKYHDNSEAKHHLWVGRSDPVKRPELLLELAKCFPSEKFVMISQQSTVSSDEYYTNLVNQANKIKNLTFLQFVESKQMNDYFFYAKTLINTSSYEGFPTTFIEASKNCTPILSLSVDPENFLTMHKGGLYANHDFEIFKQNFEILLKDKALYKKMLDNGFNYMQKHHNLTVNTQKLLDLIM